MRLLGKSIQSINKEDIERLKDNKIQESINLDYKQKLPGEFNGKNWNINDKDRKEFLADVSSFANTIGGIIIFGIEEEKDENDKNTGIPKKIIGLGSINFDQVKLRLESSIRDGLEPRLNVSIESLDINEDGNKIIILGIPRSLFAPHIIWFKNNGKFYKRNNSGKYQMDINEIRQAFLEAEEWERKAKEFKRNRIMEVRHLEFIPNLDIKGSYFLHIFPLGFKRERINLELLKKCDLIPYRYNNWKERYNFEGYLLFGVNTEGTNKICKSYVQYFRNGGIEIYTSMFHTSKYQESEEPFEFYGSFSQNATINYVKNYFSFINKIGVEPPFVIYISFLDLKNASMYTKIDGFDSFKIKTNCFNKDQILFPALFVENFDLDTISKKIYDNFTILWQAAGWEDNPLGEDGKVTSKYRLNLK